MEAHDKFCIKTIKSRHYVYSWRYRPKNERTTQDSERFEWIYVGRYGSVEVERLLADLPRKERCLLALEYHQKVIEEEKIQKEIKHLEIEEPFSSEKARLLEINNTNNRNRLMKRFNSKIRTLAKKKLK